MFPMINTHLRHKGRRGKATSTVLNTFCIFHYSFYSIMVAIYGIVTMYCLLIAQFYLVIDFLQKVMDIVY